MTEEEAQRRLDAFQRLADYLGRMREEAHNALRLGIINTEKHSVVIQNLDQFIEDLWALAAAAGIKKMDVDKPFGDPGRN